MFGRNWSLNESPSEKEGKFKLKDATSTNRTTPSMKVPPKRKGNTNTPASAKPAVFPQ